MGAAVYLAVGHGVEPNGVYDPGAIGADGREEHMEAYQVCSFAWAALRRSGVETVCEVAQGASHDPDYRGSALRANALGVRVAVEVHFDWRLGIDGFSGLYVSGAGQHLATLIGNAFEARQLPRAHDVRRTDLYFLNATHMPALIPEIRRVHDYATPQNQKEGEAVAAGICRFLGRPYKAPRPPKPPPPLSKHWAITGPDGEESARFIEPGAEQAVLRAMRAVQAEYGPQGDNAPDREIRVMRYGVGETS